MGRRYTWVGEEDGEEVHVGGGGGTHRRGRRYTYVGEEVHIGGGGGTHRRGRRYT